MSTISIDVPFSKATFAKVFGNMIDKVQSYSHNNAMTTVKVDLSVDEINLALGSDWHTFTKTTSSTIQRVLGIVRVHHRKRTLHINANDECPRYIEILLYLLCCVAFIIISIFVNSLFGFFNNSVKGNCNFKPVYYFDYILITVFSFVMCAVKNYFSTNSNNKQF